MKYLLILSILVSCSSAPEQAGPVTAEAPPEKEGVLDELMKNKDCGLLDVFYDGCKKIYSDAEKNLYKNNAENP